MVTRGRGRAQEALGGVRGARRGLVWLPTYRKGRGLKPPKKIFASGGGLRRRLRRAETVFPFSARNAIPFGGTTRLS